MRIAVFDLDGTITRRDTFPGYIRGWRRLHARSGFGARALAALWRYPFDRDRGRLKSDLIRAAMAGATRSEIRGWTDAYVSSLGAAELCPGALDAIDRHRAAGDRLVLLSASVDLYVPEIGRRLGFDEVICTQLVWRDGRLDGALATANCRAAEKRRCVEALRARHPPAKLAAYANAGSDFEHLALAEEAVLVNAGPWLRRRARKLGWRTADWRNNSAARPVQSA